MLPALVSIWCPPHRASRYLATTLFTQSGHARPRFPDVDCAPKVRSPDHAHNRRRTALLEHRSAGAPSGRASARSFPGTNARYAKRISTRRPRSHPRDCHRRYCWPPPRRSGRRCDWRRVLRRRRLQGRDQGRHHWGCNHWRADGCRAWCGARLLLLTQLKPFLLVTGVIFALIVAAHIWRIVAESHALVREPWFMLLTVLAAVMSAWAFRLATRTPHSGS